MTMILGWLLKLGVPARFAKAVEIGGIIAAVIFALGVTKCSYDRSLVRGATAKQDLKNERIDRKVDQKAADQRVQDERTADRDAQELRDAIGAQPAQPLTPRQRARICSVLKRQARERGAAPPAGC